MQHHKHTFCRICEPYCPLIAELNDAGKVIQLHPDPQHPSGGIACHKGLSYLDVHNDPDRLNWPQKRLNPRTEARGDFVDINWDDAMADIGARLKAIRETHGSNGIAVYIGNPWSMTAPAFFPAIEFQDLLGTQMRFSGATQDTSNKFACATEVFGSPTVITVPDLYNTDYLLCLGTNPRVSRWTLASIPNDGLDALKRIKQRGGKVRFVNPRKIESSTEETGPTLLIKPGTDVYFLAALLNEIHLLGGFDEALLAKRGKNLDGLKQFIQRYPAEKVAAVTGIEVATIKEIARELFDAKSAAVYMATGVNQSRQGMLAYWLVDMISFATGNLGRTGGMHKPAGLMNLFPTVTATAEIKTSQGNFLMPDPMGFNSLPAAILPKLIEDGSIRALIVFGGNPLITMGGEGEMRKAYEKLDLMISADIYRCATGELADYALPATDWIERMDINIHGNCMQPIPYVQYADAIEPPAHGRRNGWWIVARLAQVLGLPSALDANPTLTDGTDMINGLLAARNLSIDQMRATPHQTVTFPQEARETFFDKCVQHADKLVDCCPPAFAKAGLFERCDAIFTELVNEPVDTLKMISLRTPYMQNSWYTNLDRFRHGRQSVNPLNISTVDATRHGLHDGDEIRVFNQYGSIETQVLINNDLRPGVVAMSHGYGNDKAYQLRTAAAKPGVNLNVLMPIASTDYEPLSYMSWLNGVPVRVEPIARNARQVR